MLDGPDDVALEVTVQTAATATGTGAHEPAIGDLFEDHQKLTSGRQTVAQTKKSEKRGRFRNISMLGNGSEQTSDLAKKVHTPE